MDGYVINDGLHIEAVLPGFGLKTADLHPEAPFIWRREGQRCVVFCSRYSTLVRIAASIDVKPLNRYIILGARGHTHCMWVLGTNIQ
jgi:hypothetical protein